MPLVAVGARQPKIGVMKVWLGELLSEYRAAMMVDTMGERALRCFERLKASRHPDTAGCLLLLGITYYERFESLGDLPDLESSVLHMEKASKLVADGHPDKADCLAYLDASYRARYMRLGNLSDIEKASQLVDDSHPDKANYLAYLCENYRARYMRLGNLSDLQSAIFHGERAVQLIDDGHPNRALYLYDLSVSQDDRFRRCGYLPDLENAISNCAKAVDLADDACPRKWMYLLSLGTCYSIRFEHRGDLSDLESALSQHEKGIQLTDDGHPERARFLSELGACHQALFERLSNISDLEYAISYHQNAVDITNDEHAEKAFYLSNLGISQFTHFERFNDLANLEHSLLNAAKAVRLTDDGNPRKPSLHMNLSKAHLLRFQHHGDLSNLDSGISNIKQAIDLKPDARDPMAARRLSNLGVALESRFTRLGDLDDLEDAISYQIKAVELTNDGHPYKPVYLSALAGSQRSRFKRLNDLTDLNNAISNKEKAVELTDDGHPSKPQYLSGLGMAQRDRFSQPGGNNLDLENAISNTKKAVQLTDDEYPTKAGFLWNLSIVQATRFKHLGIRLDIENAISNGEKAVELGGNDLPDYLWNLGICQKIRFQSIGNRLDIDNAILNQDRAARLTDVDLPQKAGFLYSLGMSQQTRFERFRDVHDRAACVLSFKTAAQLKTARPHHALLAARAWAAISHVNGDPRSALDGYRTALELLPKVVWLGLDIDSRQDWFHHAKPENLGCLAVTCAIQLGYLEDAVELLELGRSVLWQQASALRGDLRKLAEEKPGLAKELERAGRQLDAGYFSTSDFAIADYIVSNDQRSTEVIVQERCHLVGQWERLVERVRQLPKFKYFLKPIPFHQLRRAPTTGQVIIINASRIRVDALIFGTTGPIEHVSLPNIDLATLTSLTGSVVLNRSADYRANADGRAIRRQNFTTTNLQKTLQMVWHTILVPIFDKIRIPLESNPAFPQRRIWWYPTGPLTFIPIHAAGPTNGVIDVSRIIISSYVTTLNSLFQTQQTNSPASIERLALLAISQPNTPGQTPIPQSTQEVQGVVKMARSAGLAQKDIEHLHGLNATVNRVSAALERCSWVHFACHGSQNPVLGTKSAFALHDGHLELGQIASKRLSGKFAFLSACHAASGLKELPGEAMHLAAGLQFAGFHSVIATMWGISDDDAPKVAHHTYEYLFRNGLDGVDPSDAATALNRAVCHLRTDPNVTLDRWAPFIHFGI
jgi:TPR repeat protein